ncbi:hypothetical protein BANRA_00902 [Escherichia coli]|uniref:Uncharacterized protein n=1 Tax=Escherichia coli TaxID=562 RepID=A0A3P5DMB8_ECOLX|nr:hypothetical protein BANRA_00902 [Escherichia coli]
MFYAIHMLSVCMFGMYSYFVLYIVFRCDLVCQLIAFKNMFCEQVLFIYIM